MNLNNKKMIPNLVEDKFVTLIEMAGAISFDQTAPNALDYDELLAQSVKHPNKWYECDPAEFIRKLTQPETESNVGDIFVESYQQYSEESIPEAQVDDLTNEEGKELAN